MNTYNINSQVTYNTLTMNFCWCDRVDWTVYCQDKQKIQNPVASHVVVILEIEVDELQELYNVNISV
jgi:hypothetical protein